MLNCLADANSALLFLKSSERTLPLFLFIAFINETQSKQASDRGLEGLVAANLFSHSFGIDKKKKKKKTDIPLGAQSRAGARLASFIILTATDITGLHQATSLTEPLPRVRNYVGIAGVVSFLLVLIHTLFWGLGGGGHQSNCVRHPLPEQAILIGPVFQEKDEQFWGKSLKSVKKAILDWFWIGC